MLDKIYNKLYLHLNFFAAFTYKKYKDMPDRFMFDDLHFIASIRNMQDVIVTPGGGVDARYATYRHSQEEIKEKLTSIWNEVKSTYPRKLWYDQVNKRMADFQYKEEKNKK